MMTMVEADAMVMAAAMAAVIAAAGERSRHSADYTLFIPMELLSHPRVQLMPHPLTFKTEGY